MTRRTPAHLVAQRYSERTRAWLARAGAALGLLPWAVFVLIASRSSVPTSLRVHEAFQDSGNPGYFLVKLALWLMAVAAIGQELIDFPQGSALMEWVGLALWAMVGAGIILTGLPAAVVAGQSFPSSVRTLVPAEQRCQLLVIRWAMLN